jgi:biopolymer transport protein ExbD
MSLISQNKIKIEGGMSSMPDLVFLLLIFFIILSALAKNAVDVDLPQGGVANPSKQALASVVIQPDNTISLNNQTVDISQIESAILAAIGNDEEKIVELYGDTESNYGTVFNIIEISKRNKLKVLLMSKK